MDAVSFKSVLAGAHDVAGLDLADRTDAQLESAVRKINRRVKTAWKFERWPELTVIERRLYRGEYSSATAYAAPSLTAAVEVFFTAAGKYYQTLRAATGQAPATLTAGTYEVNAAYWAESAAGYSGDDWADATAYAVAAVVRNPATGRFYACHTAHTSSGSFDATKFGVLTPFAPYVSFTQAGQTAIGEVVRLTANDPAVDRANPGVIRHVVRASGVVPLSSTPVAVWVEFRRRVPVFIAQAWQPTDTYAAGAVRYSDTGENCYTAQAVIVGAADNEAPEDDAVNWAVLEFPEVLQNFTIRAAGADLLRADGQTQKADREQGQAYAELADGRDIEVEGQGNFQDVNVQTY